MLDILGSFVTDKAKKKINAANNPTPKKTLPIAPPQKSKTAQNLPFGRFFTLAHTQTRQP